MDINIKVGGEAGFGIMASGLLLIRTFSRGGLRAITTNDYPSLIRGGHNVILVRVADHEIFATDNHVDLLIALNRETVDLHKDEVSKGAAILFDGESFQVQPGDFTKPVNLFPVPLMKLAKEHGGDELVQKNNQLAQSGFDYIKKNFPQGFNKKFTVSAAQTKKQMVLTCSEALGLGAIAAGMKFFAAYPMTPINGLLYYLAG